MVTAIGGLNITSRDDGFELWRRQFVVAAVEQSITIPLQATGPIYPPPYLHRLAGAVGGYGVRFTISRGL